MTRSGYTPPKTIDLNLTRTISAAPGEVFDAWLDAKSPGGFFHGHKAILDAKVNGLFYLAMGHEGREWAHYGRFVTLDRPGKIVHTWVSEATRGLESIVTLTLTPKGDQTEVTLRHTGVPDDDFGRQHGDGWGFILGAIEGRFARKR
jgi:uncharacterized protein YndB with AHSA1/START domain